MTAKDLKDIQDRIKFDGPSMSTVLGVPYEQYRRFIYGAAEIPEKVARAALELEAIEKQFDISRDMEYCRFLEKSYPQGIVSDRFENKGFTG